MRIVTILTLVLIMATAAACSPADWFPKAEAVKPQPVQEVAPTPLPTKAPLPTPTIDPVCDDADTIVYVVEAARLSLAFHELEVKAQGHIDKNNAKELRKDARSASDMSYQMQKYLGPPSFMRDYNDYMTAMLSLYSRALFAHADGHPDSEAIYRDGVAKLLESADKAWKEAHSYCGWEPESMN